MSFSRLDGEAALPSKKPDSLPDHKEPTRCFRPEGLTNSQPNESSPSITEVKYLDLKRDK